MSDVDKGRRLYQSRHGKPASTDDEDTPPTPTVTTGAALYDRTRIETGRTRQPTDLTFSGPAT